MTRRSWTWVRTLGGAAVLGFLVWRLGTGPFLDGLRLIDGSAVAAASVLGCVATVSSAWRWSLVARGLSVQLPIGAAVARCYRSVFLNTLLPGGVLGDADRAVRHGRDAGDIGRGVRAVVWERSAGQVVLVVLAIIVLFAFPSPLRPHMPALTAVVLVGGLAVVLLARAVPRNSLVRRLRALRTAKADIRDGLLTQGTCLGVVLASAVAVAAHLATFLVAARTAGATAPLSQLVPLTLLALLAMGLPVNIGGWGPREGVAAWAFGAAGLTAAQGVRTAVVYGALVLVASVPGAVVLAFPKLSRFRRDHLTNGREVPYAKERFVGGEVVEKVG
ncbi:lysylphosphatidylglycerol synthase transmembrane domain-containing protein [Actinopolymorpha sp. B17G11]|uniref:lysylphosphatidylglycerol synthase transmembrane domain-containing protein n=1 Tax=unclassified Actinopolymorpha TaxID=2627063 RepID=UPI0032D9978A